MQMQSCAAYTNCDYYSREASIWEQQLCESSNYVKAATIWEDNYSRPAPNQRNMLKSLMLLLIARTKFSDFSDQCHYR